MPTIIYYGVPCKLFLLETSSLVGMHRLIGKMIKRGWQFSPCGKTIQMGNGPCYRSGYYPEVLLKLELQKQLVEVACDYSPDTGETVILYEKKLEDPS
jgi:hypothetical protein